MKYLISFIDLDLLTLLLNPQKLRYIVFPYKLIHLDLRRYEKPFFPLSIRTPILVKSSLTSIFHPTFNREV